jgi:hypothetical protein
MNSQLDQIRALIEAHELSLAQDKLKKFLKDNPESAQGWFLASFVQPTPEMRLTSIKRAAKLQPSHQEIQKRLVKLESAAGKKKITRLLAIVVVALGILLTLAVILLNQRPLPASDELPTLAVLRAETDVPTQQILATATDISVLQPKMTSVNLGETGFNSTIESTVQTAIVSIVTSTPVFIVPQPNNSLPQPTAYTGATAFITPTLVSSNPTNTLAPTTISSQPTVASPAGIPTTVQVVPLSSVIAISKGEFRVVDAKRGAESMIQDLGGSFPPAPPNQSWFLLELLLICKNSPSCVFDPSILKIIGSSGTIYSYSPQLNLAPSFGTTTENNQVWGYLGFTIPTNETSLKLTLSENGQTYSLALE